MTERTAYDMLIMWIKLWITATSLCITLRRFPVSESLIDKKTPFLILNTRLYGGFFRFLENLREKKEITTADMVS